MTRRREVPASAKRALPVVNLSFIVALVLIAGAGFLPDRPAHATDGQEPPYPHGEFEDDCSMCHSPDGWAPAVISKRFEHQRSGFALDGAHGTASCRACHLSLEFNRVESTCVSCHLDVHQGEFGVDCAGCHTTSQFVDRFEDVRSHSLTRFPLSGAHTTLDCAACHPIRAEGESRFVNTPMECQACHLDAYLSTTDPDHAALEFDRDCEQCHETAAWAGIRFDRFDHNRTGFSLSGAHSSLDCTQCHADDRFTGTPADCYSCHQQHFETATRPNHASAGFSTQCQECHTSQAWSPASFDHSAFPLSGGHGGVTCQECHISSNYETVSSDCISCHPADYQDAPAHLESNFPLTCEECHDINSWQGANFNHDLFALSGGHSGLTCQQCHTTGVYGTLPSDCNSCHQNDFEQASGHVSSGFPVTCEQCHSVTTWLDATFDHSVFSLNDGHGGVTCQQCHTTGVYETMPTDCVFCHQSDYVEAPNHVASNFSQTCQQCHTVTEWADATFDHSLFPLTGGHDSVSCEQCHTTGVFETIPSDCNSCHQSDFQEAPGHVSSGFPLTCEQCHAVTTWLDATFDHSFFALSDGHGGVTCQQCHTTGVYETMPTDCVFCHQSDYVEAPSHVASNFSQTCQQCHNVTTWADSTYDHSFFALTGGHNGVTCLQCHTSGVYETVPSDCNSCHANDYQQAPGHVSSGFPLDCVQCHTVTTWLDATFDHGVFSLTGGHDSVSCEQCHTTGVYETIPSDCNSCHQTDFQEAPGHVSSGFPLTCEQCHAVTTWLDATFDHSFFALSDGHGSVTCQQCHTTGVYETMPTDCVFCHQSDYVEAPSHVLSNFSQTCQQCHTVTTWADATYDHSFFALTGGHNGVACVQCHTSGVYETIPSDCNSCHQTDYQEAPGHVSSGFPLDCVQCHTVTTWLDATFDHGLFPLTGGHGSVNCEQCHTTGVFETIPSDCNSCHQTDFQEAPGHVSSGFPLDCVQCHTVTTWLDATFDHSFFALSDGHGGVTCQQCHTTGVYETMPTDCVFCHQSDYVEAPSHVLSNFSQTCQQCHTVTTWTDATYDHSFFALTGGHNGVACVQCHTSGVYETVPSDCNSCHQTDFQEAPGHVSSGFPLDCVQCHTVTTWLDATFDHSLFPLTGGHNSVSCEQCHTTGVFETIPSDCNSCHQTDYQEAPGHVSSGFPLDCVQCHTVTTWLDATFDHSFFTLSDGHGGLTCQQCHTTGVYDTMPTDCVFCHQADYVEAPSHVLSNFSQTCQQCHTVTTWADATYDHSFFALTGGHNGVACVQCHTTGVYETIPSDCNSCHQTDFQEAPGHVSSGFPLTCEQCHTVTTWLDATFDHSLFPLTGAHNGVACVQCHTNGTYGTIPSDCFSCHQTDYQEAPGHVSSAFPTTCQDCHTATTWLDATFDHAFFSLTGGHNGLQCVACHTTGTYGTIPSDCASCHQDDYQQATGHATSGFPMTCQDCHTVTTWLNATFDHGIFSLNGGHNGLTCQQCHTTGTYGTIPSDCVFCHQADYVEAPSHVASNFPQTCENCHTITVWSNATYPHQLFPLTGGHNGLTCVQCHPTGIYGTIPTDCYSCHQAEYVAAPDHQTLGFPLDCESCHNTNAWFDVNFFHSFPLNGPHSDRQCSECHIGGTTNDFSCLGACHKHTIDRMDEKHRQVSGYAYDFNLCLACHPDGRH